MSSSIEVRGGRPTLVINDRPVYPLIYALTDVPGGRFSWEDVPAHNVRQFGRRAGFALFQFDLAMDMVWREDGSIDLETARHQIRGAVAARPDAGVMLRLHVRPPTWWVAKHPEENTGYLTGPTAAPIEGGWNRYLEEDLRRAPRASLASKRWLEELGQVVERFCHELSVTPEGDALIALQVAGGVYGEWHYWSFNTDEIDNGPAMTTRFREYLTTQYSTDAALQKAWNQPAAALATASVPDLAARSHLGDGSFRDPLTDRPTIDYYACQHGAVADAILHFCRIVKRSWPRPIVTGAFYGYFFSVFGREAAGGHLALRQVLESPHIDFLCAPSAYYPEAAAVGEVYRSRSLLESVRMHGKLWLDEMDQAPPVKAYTAPDYREHLKMAVAQVRRNMLFTVVHGTGEWFYDFGPCGFASGPVGERMLALGVMGWWDDPHVLDDIAAVRRLMEGIDPAQPSVADVLAVFDTESYFHTGSTREVTDAVSHALNNWGSLGLYRANVAFDSILLSDLPRVDLKRYSTVFFFNTFRMSAAERRDVRERVAKDGRHVVFVYAPGYTDGARNDDAYVREVTGLDLKRIDLAVPAVINTDVEKFGIAMTYRVNNTPFRPLYAVADPEAILLGRYSDTPHVAIATVASVDHTTHYLGLPHFSPALTAALIRHTPAHRYSTDDGDVVYAGAGIVVLHTKSGGERSVQLKNGKRVALHLPRGPNTVVADANSGQLLLEPFTG